MKLSIIIPCYNEAKNLPLILKRCEEVVSKESNIEIVIVDNGSTDNTSIVLDNLTSNISFVTRVKVENNLGYGHGILEGLRKAKGEILGWTHADMQTDIYDVLTGLNFFQITDKPEQLFVKGRRYNRPILDVFFTIGMAIFETILLKKLMWDINSQPTMFHREFFLNWEAPPDDFSLDLYAYYLARKSRLKIKRFPVQFGKRAHGFSHWNVSVSAKFRFIKRTLHYSFLLNKRFKDDA